MTPLIQDFVREMVDRIVAEFHPRRVYLFGSYVWGTPAADSDIDLMVVVDRLQESSTRMARRAYRAIRRREAPVDILFRGLDSFTVKAAHPSTLEHKVQREGILLHG
jgi:predicted nucleotidyltransferase